MQRPLVLIMRYLFMSDVRNASVALIISEAISFRQDGQT